MLYTECEDITKFRCILNSFTILLGGPYSVFAGRDASRALATFEVHSVSEEYDDLSDLKQSELNEVKEWDQQFSEKYTLVGKLLKPGEQPTTYSDDEGTESKKNNKIITLRRITELKYKV